jgi:hypothetical protein
VVSGDFLQNGGAVEFELAGLLRGTEFDAIDVSGLANLNGTLDINLVGGYVPAFGDSFELVNFVSFAGNPDFDFSDANLSVYGLQWNTSQFSTGGILFVSAIPEPCTAILMLPFLGLIGRRDVRKRNFALQA